jgi:hypothetical protein
MRSVIRDHRRQTNDRPFASLRHQWSKFGNEEIRDLYVERIDFVERLFTRFMSRAKGINSGILGQFVGYGPTNATRRSCRNPDLFCTGS